MAKTAALRTSVRALSVPNRPLPDFVLQSVSYVIHGEPLAVKTRCNR